MVAIHVLPSLSKRNGLVRTCILSGYVSKYTSATPKNKGVTAHASGCFAQHSVRQPASKKISEVTPRDPPLPPDPCPAHPGGPTFHHLISVTSPQPHHVGKHLLTRQRQRPVLPRTPESHPDLQHLPRSHGWPHHPHGWSSSPNLRWASSPFNRSPIRETGME